MSHRSLTTGAILIFLTFLGISTGINCPRNLTSSTIMNCSASYLTQMPSLAEVPTDIEILDLSRNKISKISHMSGHEENTLMAIDLSRNEISSIEHGSFGSLQKLQGLDLSFNKLHGSALKDPNGFETMEFHVLRRLSLKGNPLEKISRLTFTSVGYLELEFLDLSQCRLHTLEHSAIQGLPVLKSLNLSHNFLDKFDPDSIESLLEIETLDFSFNRIDTIDGFPLTFSMKKVYFQNNKISYIKDNAFSPATSLEFISLAYNNLMQLSPLSIPWNTAQMALTGNPWRCDCRLRWLTEPSKEVDTQTINATIM